MNHFTGSTNSMNEVSQLANMPEITFLSCIYMLLSIISLFYFLLQSLFFGCMIA